MKNKALFIILIVSGLQFAKAQNLPIRVEPVTSGFYVHTTYQLLSNEVPFPSNGMIVETSDGVLLIDTGWGVPNTKRVYRWVRKKLKKKIKLCIATHSHDDRASGTAWLQKRGVQVVSTPLTAEKTDTQGFGLPSGILPNDTTFVFGGVEVTTFFPGEGHTEDNIVIYFPAQRILFGGCFIKSYQSFGLGNIVDANTKTWADALRRMMERFPNPAFVIPGHQAWDDASSLKHTLELIEKANAKIIGG